MKRILVLILVVSIVSIVSIGSVVNAAMAEDGYIEIGDYGEDVIAIHQKLSELGYYGLRAESPWSEKSQRALMILQENMDWPVTGAVENVEDILAVEHVVGKNLAVGTSDQWSEWMSPQYNVENSCFNVAVAELGEKAIGDYYTCGLEIELKDVAATPDLKFWIRTQGSVDGSWSINNPWMNFMSLHEVPQDGIYQYSRTSRIDEGNVEAVKYDLGFRCDYWGGGSFRVRNVKVEKGKQITEWKAAE